MARTGFDSTHVFTRAIEGVMRPLIRALIARGVTAPVFYRMIKRLYVEVAERDFALARDRPTDSRISMLTGVHRRDVRAFRDQDRSEEQAAGERVTTIASVLGKWLANPALRGEDGAPLPLLRAGEDGPSFEGLVRSVSKDVRPRTVLDELVRQGLVEIAGGQVHLRANLLLAPSDPDQRVHFFAENVGDHIAAAVDNLLAEDPPFVERSVFYNRLTPASVDRIEAEALALGDAALMSLNSTAHACQTDDLDAAEGTHRFRFGVFFYRVDEGMETDGVGEDGTD